MWQVKNCTTDFNGTNETTKIVLENVVYTTNENFQQDVEEMMSLRNRIYQILNEERAYQDNLSQKNCTHARERVSSFSVTDELLMIARNVSRAIEEWCDQKNDQQALCAVRKIAAISIRCMENHGVPTRAEEMELRDEE